MRAALALAVLGAAVLVGSAGSAPSQTAQVTMPAKLFAPRDLQVLVGTTVTWRNVDTTTHTVTEDEGEFDSGFVRPGGTFAATFAEQGIFVYHCTIHRFMRGTVQVFRVVLSGPEEPLPAGRRARLEGVAPAGVTEVVLERVSPGPREVVARATPGTDGVFGFTVRAPEPRGYRVRAGSASSPTVRVRVTPHVQIARRGDGDRRLRPSGASRQPSGDPDVRTGAVRLRHGRARATRRVVSRSDSLRPGAKGARARGSPRQPGLERRLQPPSRRSPALIV